MVGTGADVPMVTGTYRPPMHPRPSVYSRRSGYVPGVFGVPLSTPAGLSRRPGGSEAPDHVPGEALPLCVNVKEYGVP